MMILEVGWVDTQKSKLMLISIIKKELVRCSQF